MARFEIKEGDILPEYQVTLYSETGAVQDLTTLTYDNIEFKYRLKGSRSRSVVRTATVVDAANGVVKHTWGEGDTVTAGIYESEWVVNLTGGGTKTFPSSKFEEFTIRSGL